MSVPRGDLSAPGVPLLCKARLDIPPSSHVLIRLKGSPYEFMGLCRDNPLDTPSPDTVVLFDVVGREPHEDKTTLFNRREFAHMDIAVCKDKGEALNCELTDNP